MLSLIDEILESEAKLAVLTCTQSDDRDQIWKSLASQLGDERVAQIRPIKWPEFQSEEVEPFSEDTLRKDIREVNLYLIPHSFFVLRPRRKKLRHLYQT